MKIVIVTGMSGAGKRTALKVLEDAGYYQVFCLYTAMIDFPTFYEQSVSGEKQKVKEWQSEKIREIEKHKN